MTKRQIALTAHAVLLIALMFAIVPLLTGWNPQWGFLLAFALYWIGFCIPVIAVHVWNRDEGRSFSESLDRRNWWVPLLLLLQVVLVAIASFVPNTSILTTQGAMLAAVFSIINGPLEEAAWRGGFLTTFRDKPRLGFVLNWLLFSAWHLPLISAQGITFDGGGMTLFGGATVLGLLWSWLAWRTGSVFYVAIAHALTNLLTFWVLFDLNGFV